MTPLLAIRFGTTTAVVVVTLPHAAATVVRCWRLRAHVDRTILVRFGLLSAAGALAGALIYTRLGPGALTRVLGGLLLSTAGAQLTGWTSQWQPHGPVVALFGLLSGFFGGIAGNQGGLRSAALTAFGLPPLGFVATATATGLLVDAARTPVYVWHSGPLLLELWVPLIVATIGVLIGTIVGERILLGLSPRRFGRAIGVAIGALGVWMSRDAGLTARAGTPGPDAVPTPNRATQRFRSAPPLRMAIGRGDRARQRRQWCPPDPRFSHYDKSRSMSSRSSSKRFRETPRGVAGGDRQACGTGTAARLSGRSPVSADRMAPEWKRSISVALGPRSVKSTSSVTLQRAVEQAT